MRCERCKLCYPYTYAEATCLTCGTPLKVSSEDLLGKSPVQIVRETRGPQVEMAKMVEQSVVTGVPLVAEAGTGTGKSFAVLLPAILSGKSVVISTATTLLQHQYATKDLPFLQKALAERGVSFRYAVIKGKSHYFCPAAYAAAKRKLDPAPTPEFTQWVQQIMEGELDGDRIELGERNIATPEWWWRVNAEECPGAKHCASVRRCGFARVRAQVKEAHVIVANHSIVGYNMRCGRRLLPEHSIYVMDEAHQAERYFRTALSSEINERAALNLRKFLEENDCVDYSAKGSVTALDQMVEACEALFHELQLRHGGSGGSSGADVILDPAGLNVLIGKITVPLNVLYKQISGEVVRRGEEGGGDEDDINLEDKLYCERAKAEVGTDTVVETGMRTADDGALMAALRKVSRLSDNLAEIMRQAEAGAGAGTRTGTGTSQVLYYTTSRGRSTAKITLAPVFLSHILSTALYPATTVIATSATLTVKGDFQYFRERMGVPANALEFRVPSPFDYSRRVCLYLAPDLPLNPSRGKGGGSGSGSGTLDSAYENYFNALALRIAALINMSRGGAFVLFSARTEMQNLYERVKGRVPYPVRMQEEGAGAGALELWFRQEKNPVLFGVKSFWEGISIEGDQLRMVIIPKVPFPNRSDPIHQAKCAALEAQGVRPFGVLDVPEMITDMQQGFGRLIRTMTDFGVVAILDGKIHEDYRKTWSYANALLQSLPQCFMCSKLELVEQFLNCYLPVE